MEINLAKFEKGVIGIVAVLFALLMLYLTYTLFFVGPAIDSNPSLATITPANFGPKVQKAAATLTDKTQKVMLGRNDLMFTETALYKSFTDLPLDVPLSDKRGRPDPFVPYVAP